MAQYDCRQAACGYFNQGRRPEANWENARQELQSRSQQLNALKLELVGSSQGKRPSIFGGISNAEKTSFFILLGRDVLNEPEWLGPLNVTQDVWANGEEVEDLTLSRPLSDASMLEERILPVFRLSHLLNSL